MNNRDNIDGRHFSGAKARKKTTPGAPTQSVPVLGGHWIRRATYVIAVVAAAGIDILVVASAGKAFTE
jgi:hypothetical protein